MVNVSDFCIKSTKPGEIGERNQAAGMVLGLQLTGDPHGPGITAFCFGTPTNYIIYQHVFSFLFACIMEHQKNNGQALSSWPMAILMAASLDRWERCIVDPWRRTHLQETGSIHTFLMSLEKELSEKHLEKTQVSHHNFLSKQCYC